MILPKWAIDALIEEVGRVQVLRQGGFFAHDNPNTKVRLVCGACNHSWLSELDAYAKSLLRSRMFALAPENAFPIDGVDVRLARWAAKTFVNRALGSPHLSPAEATRAFCVGTAIESWRDSSFMLAWSFGPLVVQGSKIPTLGFEVRQPDGVEYREFTVGSFHFHLVIRHDANRDSFRYFVERMLEVRGAERLPLTSHPRTIRELPVDPVSSLAKAAVCKDGENVAQALRRVMEDEFSTVDE